MKNTLALIMALILLLSTAFISSCTKNPQIGYKYFENDYFSLEYPDNYTLVENSGEADSLLSDYLIVEFTGWRRSLIRVTMQRPGTEENRNAGEVFERIVNDTAAGSDRYNTGQKIIMNRIEADYLESVRIDDIPITVSNTIYKQSELSFRTAVFDYSEFIWQIGMYWDYYSEPFHVQEDFAHIIETFKIYKENL